MGNTLNTFLFSAPLVYSPLPPHLNFSTSMLVFLSLLPLIYACYKFHELIYVCLSLAFHLIDLICLFLCLQFVKLLYFGFPQSYFSDLCLSLLNPVQQYSMSTITSLWKYFQQLYSKVIRPFHRLKYGLFANFFFPFVNYSLNSPF